MRAHVFNGFCFIMNLYFLVCVLCYPKESKLLYCSEDRHLPKAESLIEAAVLLPCRDGLLPPSVSWLFSFLLFSQLFNWEFKWYGKEGINFQNDLIWKTCDEIPVIQDVFEALSLREKTPCHLMEFLLISLPSWEQVPSKNTRIQCSLREHKSWDCWCATMMKRQIH